MCCVNMFDTLGKTVSCRGSSPSSCYESLRGPQTCQWQCYQFILAWRSGSACTDHWPYLYWSLMMLLRFRLYGFTSFYFLSFGSDASLYWELKLWTWGFEHLLQIIMWLQIGQLTQIGVGRYAIFLFLHLGIKITEYTIGRIRFCCFWQTFGFTWCQQELILMN